MDRAQVSVEFFIVAAFVLALAGSLLSVASNQINQNNLLDHLALARNAVGVVSSYINFVGLGGIGTNVSATIFTPQNTICFLQNSSGSNLYCTELNGYNVSGEPLFFTPSIYSNCYQQGWTRVVISNNGGVIVNCTQLS